MIGSSCSEKNCPGWAGVLIVGAVVYAIVLIKFLGEIL